MAAERNPRFAARGAAGGRVKRCNTRAISATVLQPVDQQRYSKLITEAFGADLPVAFKVDPQLIAGFELHGPHLLIANSWRADLTQILADIAHDRT